jgi:hypothetical protein
MIIEKHLRSRLDNISPNPNPIFRQLIGSCPIKASIF